MQRNFANVGLRHETQPTISELIRNGTPVPLDEEDWRVLGRTDNVLAA